MIIRRDGGDKVRGALWLLLLALAAPAAASERFALLVGINRYLDPVPSLAGAENDAAGVRDALIAHWGVPADHITLLRGQDANRLGVLNGVTSILSRSNPGDQVFVFFAGHGTSASDLRLGRALPHTTGALLPADFELDNPAFVDELIVGRRDLRPLFEALDRGGRKVFVAIDACYSGNTVRGAYADALGRPRLPSRSADAVEARVAADSSHSSAETATPYPYKNVVYLSAAGEHEVAGDIPAEYLKYYPTRDNKPHGAFSDALIRALNGDLPRRGAGAPSYSELYEQVVAFMQQRGYPQTPQLLPAIPADGEWIATAPVLGASAAAAKAAPAPAALRVRYVGEALDERLRKLDGVAWVETDASLALIRRAETYLLVTPSGDLVARLPDAAAVAARLELQANLATLQRVARSGALAVGVDDDVLGRTRVDGEPVAFRLKLARGGFVALLALDAEGTLRVLYPYFDAEFARAPGGRALALDGTRVSAPFGQDLVLALAWDERPAWLAEYLRRDLALGSEAQKAFVARLTRAAKDADAASLAIVTTAKPAPRP